MNERTVKLLLPAAGLCCVAAGGCAISHPDYPSAWPALDVAKRDCFSIGGVYENKGIFQKDPAAPPLAKRIVYLSRWMFFDERTFRASIRYEPPQEPVDHESVDSIAIGVTRDGTLEVEGRYEGQPLIKKQFLASKRDYRCEDGKIHMTRFGAESQGVLVLLGAHHSATTIARANDGSLVVEDAGKGVGVFVAVIPFAGSISTWSRFQPYTPAIRESETQAKSKDFVHCVVGGERRWAHWSKCD